MHNKKWAGLGCCVIVGFGIYYYAKYYSRKIRVDTIKTTIQFTDSDRHLNALKDNLTEIRKNISVKNASLQNSISLLKNDFFKQNTLFRSDDPSLLELHESLQSALQSGLTDSSEFYLKNIERVIEKKQNKLKLLESQAQ